MGGRVSEGFHRKRAVPSIAFGPNIYFRNDSFSVLTVKVAETPSIFGRQLELGGYMDFYVNITLLLTDLWGA
jgi:hypothetical protein